VITAVFPATATTISVAAVAGVTKPVRGATPVTTTTAGTGYTGTVSWSGSPSTFAGATSYTATIILTATSGYTLTGVSANFFTVAGATSVTHSADSGVITAVFPATYKICNRSGFATCNQGDTGPGGGTIFYISTDGFNCGPTHTNTGSPTGNRCYYLEVAPSGWNQTINDPDTAWARALNADISEITNISARALVHNNAAEIGLGYKNSIAIVSQNNNYGGSSIYAAALAREYSGGTLTDWYLPTAAELNLLCQWNRGDTRYAMDIGLECGRGGGVINSANFGAETAGFLESNYWSSSEGDSSFAWYLDFRVSTLYLDYKYRGTGDNRKFVRPVRSF
jgi:hypothetical protein